MENGKWRMENGMEGRGVEWSEVKECSGVGWGGVGGGGMGRAKRTIGSGGALGIDRFLIQIPLGNVRFRS